MGPEYGYFGTMGAIALFLVALFCLDRALCRRSAPENERPGREWAV